jgi:glutathione-regulated potassium-efflux system ancillary protein KefC
VRTNCDENGLTMDPHSFLYSAVLLLVVASVAVALFRHFGLGTILGLLVTGIIVGPHTPGPFVTREVEERAPVHRDRRGDAALPDRPGDEAQPPVEPCGACCLGWDHSRFCCPPWASPSTFTCSMHSWTTSLLLGAGFALSSTAIVIQMLRDKGEVASQHGQAAFAVLLMQDLAVVPLLAIIPVIADVGPLPKWTAAVGACRGGTRPWSRWSSWWGAMWCRAHWTIWPAATTARLFS